MTTIKFTEDQYKALLEVLAYNQQDEERDVCEKYPALDEMNFRETSSYSKQLKMLREVGATDHIYYARCITYLAIDGEDEEELEDCDCCGYTHHSEDKCPNEATAEHYVKWRKEEMMTTDPNAEDS
jgi:hypothetical protein